MEVNTFFIEDECGSDSHSTGSGRGRGKIGGRSQGSALNGGSNPGRASSGGRSAGGGRSTTSGRGRGQGGMPPPTEGSSAKRPRKITPRVEKLSSLARTRLRKEACDFFSKNSMQFLERMYLSSGKAGLDSLRKHLLNLFLLALGSDDEYLRDIQIPHYQDRVQDIV
jgi:hypothetical protein